MKTRTVGLTSSITWSGLLSVTPTLSQAWVDPTLALNLALTLAALHVPLPNWPLNLYFSSPLWGCNCSPWEEMTLANRKLEPLCFCWGLSLKMPFMMMLIMKDAYVVRLMSLDEMLPTQQRKPNWGTVFGECPHRNQSEGLNSPLILFVHMTTSGPQKHGKPSQSPI
jgi:hypothetical protein